MTVDKIKLRALAKDRDERFFDEGDYLDALNVVTSGTGNSTEGTIKNVKGTLPGTPLTVGDTFPTEAARVIGSVSDPSRGYIYFFVWSTTSTNHAIYRYKSLNDTYEIVLKSSVLAFQQYSFVNVEIINSEFRKDQDRETILYFTDNINPPRKINVDRAIEDNNFIGYTNDQIFEILSVAKTPCVFPPTVTLDTDAGKTTNDLLGKSFQFATQFIYKDGERSALSPHSEITYCRYMTLQGINSASITQETIQAENRALINTRWVDLAANFEYNQADVDKMVVYGRVNNTSAWFIIDEFDPAEDLVKPDPHNNAQSFTYYTVANGIYRFYNDGLYPYQSGEVTDRVYDDVPQKATSQAIVGNRLMYASPNSGYGNVEATASFTITHNTEPSTGSYFSEATNDVSNIQHESIGGTTSSANGWFAVGGVNLPETLNAGTELTVNVDYKPSDFAVYGVYDHDNDSFATDNPVFRVVTDEGGTEKTYYCGKIDTSGPATGTPLQSYYDGAVQIPADGQDAYVNWANLSASITVTVDTDRATYLAALITELETKTLNYEYTRGDGSIALELKNTVDGSSNTHTLFTKRLSWDVVFDVVLEDSGNYISGQTGTDDVLVFYPKPGNFSIPTGTLSEENTASGLLSGGAAPYTSIRVGSSGYNFISGSITAAEDFFRGYTDEATPDYIPTLQNGVNVGDEIKDKWGTYTLSPQTTGAKDEQFTALPTTVRRTFKSGSAHDIGVVYFDRHGRPGYVNELGSVYVPPFSSGRANGATDIQVNITSDPPEWATSFQYVYPGMGSWERFETYTVGGAFQYTGSDPYNDPIYISLNTLSQFQSEKGALKDYSFTAGDRLRIVNYRNEDNSALVYPPEEIIFDVVGVEVFATAQDFIEYTAPPDTASEVNHSGTFLKILRIGAGTENQEFDGTADNYWKNQTLVEILTPKEQVETKVYYEIGTAYAIADHGSAQLLSEGDVHFRPMSLLVPNYEAGATDAFQANNYADWTYIARSVESMDFSDFVSSRCWSKGRAHVKYERAANITYYNRIAYSEEYGDDIGYLTMSSFNPAAYSYKNFPKKHGAINFVGNLNQNLVALQENKLSIVPVNRNVIEYADGDSNITVNQEVFGSVQESNGDFGCGNDQSSVLIQDGFIFFADRSRQKILMSNGSEMIPISDIEMSSYFEDEFDGLANANIGANRIVSGYDPEENMYYVTMEPRGYDPDNTQGSGPYAGTTVGYSLGDKRWISRYSFLPSNYANIDNKMLSCSYYNVGPSLFWVHNGTGQDEYNTFYNTAYESTITVVSKLSPSNVKVFNAVSYEGQNLATNGVGLWSIAAGDINTNLGLISGSVSFTEKEGSLYSKMPRSTVGGAGDSQYINLGDLTFVTGSTSPIYTAPLNLSALPLPLNKSISLLVMTGPPPEIYTGVVIDSIVANTITFDFSGAVPSLAVDYLDGLQVYVGLDASENGDSIRGNWCQMKFTMGTAAAAREERELYCINTHLADSKLHHPKGQQ